VFALFDIDGLHMCQLSSSHSISTLKRKTLVQGVRFPWFLTIHMDKLVFTTHMRELMYIHVYCLNHAAATQRNSCKRNYGEI
jgi:hypothetical protein